VVLFAIIVLGIACSGDNGDDPTDGGPVEDSDTTDGSDGEAGADADADADGDLDEEDGDVVPVLPREADEVRLADVIERLSTDEMAGRLTGTASGDAAEAMVIEALESTGIEVATQDVSFPLFEVLGPAELAVLDEDGEVLANLAYIDDFREVDFSGSGSVTGDLVFLSYGFADERRDDYVDVEVEGRVAVILTGVPPGSGMVPEDDGRIDLKIDTAHEHGAVGVIFLPAGDDAGRDVERPLEMELFAQDKYGDFHADLHHPELPVAFVHVDSTMTFAGVPHGTLVPAEPGYELNRRVRLEINGNVHEDAFCRNVFGVMRGTDPEIGSEGIILGAHYDHIGVGADGRIFNGASDNASGTGIVLETAATMMESGFEPRRTILFALWCAEEQGLWGSIEYGAYGTPLFPLADTQLMIQVDWIGGSDGPYLTNGDTNTHLRTFVGDEREADELPLRYIDWRGGCASDDCIFIHLGIPAYRLIAYGDYHHIAEDDIENLDMTMIDRVADMCIRGIGAIGF